MGHMALAPLHSDTGAISACVEPLSALPDLDPIGRKVWVIAASAVGIPDGRLEVGDVQVTAKNDMILRVEAVKSEGGHSSALPFQGIGSGVELGGQLEQVPFHVLTGKLLRHLPQTQGARTELGQVHEESFGQQSPPDSLTSGSTGVSLCRQRPKFFAGDTGTMR
jgi:hypothetical protein